jgi:hypothetical protein
MPAAEPIRLEYDAKSFAIDASSALDAQQSFLFTIRGAAWSQLEPHVAGDGIPNWATLSTRPKLQLLVVLLALALARTARIRVRPRDGFAEVLIDEIGVLHVTN